MATEAELAMLVEDYRTVLVKLAESARDCGGSSERQCAAEMEWGYAFDAGVAAGLEQAAVMAQSMLSGRRLDTKHERSTNGSEQASPAKQAGTAQPVCGNHLTLQSALHR